MKKIIYSSGAPAPIGPYSQAVLTEQTLYVSGQIPVDPKSGELVTGNIVKETEQVMLNIQAILAEAGFDFNHVVKCSIFIRNMGEFQRINETYGKFFMEEPPARETVEVSRLPKDVNVEISCIAVRPRHAG
jgi:2-iminobutanoate/2-iminopropanoate deaminase